jgi:hypothetical protein
MERPDILLPKPKWNWLLIRQWIETYFHPRTQLFLLLDISRNRLKPHAEKYFQYLIQQLDEADKDTKVVKIQCDDTLFNNAKSFAIVFVCAQATASYLHLKYGTDSRDTFNTIMGTQIGYGRTQPVVNYFNYAPEIVWENDVTDINHFLPAPNWHLRFHTENTTQLASVIYNENKWEITPILADALQDEGYDDELTLNLLRSKQLKKGCWIIDQLTGKLS